MKSKIINFIIFSIVFFPCLAMSNGTASHPGIDGSEIFVREEKPSNFLKTSEVVVIDVPNGKVSVDYNIVNKSDDVYEFSMLFPIQTPYDFIQAMSHGERFIDYTEFNVTLNGYVLKISEVDRNFLKISKGYKSFVNDANAFVLFDLKLKPGINHVKIRHKFHGSEQDADISMSWNYRYSIWPAKNWVSKFDSAIWRIYLPANKIYGYEFNEKYPGWYEYKDDGILFRRDLEIEAPGVVTKNTKYIEYSAKDFVPSGEIKISLNFSVLELLVKTCEIKDIDNCWIKSAISTISQWPYVGDKKKYLINDLYVVMVDEYKSESESEWISEFRYRQDSLPYIRNEIYARKGYIFKSENMFNFFKNMPWYTPLYESVVLNETEKSNVKFIKSLEENPDLARTLIEQAKNENAEKFKEGRIQFKVHH